MNETIILYTYEKQIELPKNKKMLIKTISGNYHLGQFDGKLFSLSDTSYLSTATVITHYAILE
jgi:hypothetical protein